MANGPSLLSRIGQGAISFGSGQSRSQIETTRAQRDLAEGDVALQQQQIQANDAEALKQQQVQGLIATVQEGGPNSQDAANRLFQLAPDRADQLFKNMGATSEDQREDASRRAAKILGTPFAEREPVIRAMATELEAQGRDPRETLSLIGETEREQDSELQLVQGAALSTKERGAETRAAATAGREEQRLGLEERRVKVLESQSVGLKNLKESERSTKETAANLKTEEGLRKEVNTLLKDFFQVADANARVKAAGTNPTAAGDLALIFNYMKMLDPGSTVREGEFATAEQSASIPTRIVGLYNKIVTGERLPEEQRQDFLARAEDLFQAAQTEAGKTAESFETIASNAGVNVENVLATFQARSQPGDGGESGNAVGRFQVETVQ